MCQSVTEALTFSETLHPVALPPRFLGLPPSFSHRVCLAPSSHVWANVVTPSARLRTVQPGRPLVHNRKMWNVSVMRERRNRGQRPFSNIIPAALLKIIVSFSAFCFSRVTIVLHLKSQLKQFKGRKVAGLGEVLKSGTAALPSARAHLDALFSRRHRRTPFSRRGCPSGSDAKRVTL